MHVRRLVLLIILAAALCAPSAAAGTAISHVRSTDRVVLAALARGIAHSATFRALVQRLEASDVIVHVERRPVSVHQAGVTRFIVATPYARYMRITLEIDSAVDTSVALLGHELRHAVEAADAPQVTDQESYGLLYAAIGRPSCPPPRWCFDTAEAIAAGSQVHAELRAGRRRSARLPTATKHHQRQGDD